MSSANVGRTAGLMWHYIPFGMLALLAVALFSAVRRDISRAGDRTAALRLKRMNRLALAVGLFAAVAAVAVPAVSLMSLFARVAHSDPHSKGTVLETGIDRVMATDGLLVPMGILVLMGAILWFVTNARAVPRPERRDKAVQQAAAPDDRPVGPTGLR